MCFAHNHISLKIRFPPRRASIDLLQPFNQQYGTGRAECSCNVSQPPIFNTMPRFHRRREILRRLQQIVITRERATVYRNVLVASDDDSDSSNSDSFESENVRWDDVICVLDTIPGNKKGVSC